MIYTRFGLPVEIVEVDVDPEEVDDQEIQGYPPEVCVRIQAYDPETGTDEGPSRYTAIHGLKADGGLEEIMEAVTSVREAQSDGGQDNETE